MAQKLCRQFGAKKHPWVRRRIPFFILPVTQSEANNTIYILELGLTLIMTHVPPIFMDPPPPTGAMIY